MAVDSPLVRTAKLFENQNAPSDESKAAVVVCHREIVTVSRCRTMQEWRSLTNDQRLAWVKSTLECDPDMTQAYVDIVNGLVAEPARLSAKA